MWELLWYGGGSCFAFQVPKEILNLEMGANCREEVRRGRENKRTGSKSVFFRRVICPLNFIPICRMLAARHLLPRHNLDVYLLKT